MSKCLFIIWFGVEIASFYKERKQLAENDNFTINLSKLEKIWEIRDLYANFPNHLTKNYLKTDKNATCLFALVSK